MKTVIAVISSTLLLYACTNAQSTNEPKLVGAPCEGCEAVFEYGNKSLNPTDTLPDFQEGGPRIKISGTVYQIDGKTPAKNVILYVYHTNQDGYYVPKENAQDWGKRHGYIRGWVKTDKNGNYEFYTLKPAPYPNRTDPMHIHYTVLEPNGRHYWIDDAVFEGDPRLGEYNPNEARGGNGLVNLKQTNGLLSGKRDIILGKNVNDYED